MEACRWRNIRTSSSATSPPWPCKVAHKHASLSQTKRAQEQDAALLTHDWTACIRLRATQEQDTSALLLSLRAFFSDLRNTPCLDHPECLWMSRDAVHPPPPSPKLVQAVLWSVCLCLQSHASHGSAPLPTPLTVMQGGIFSGGLQPRKRAQDVPNHSSSAVSVAGLQKRQRTQEAAAERRSLDQGKQQLEQGKKDLQTQQDLWVVKQQQSHLTQQQSHLSQQVQQAQQVKIDQLSDGMADVSANNLALQGQVGGLQNRQHADSLVIASLQAQAAQSARTHAFAQRGRLLLAQNQQVRHGPTAFSCRATH